MKEIEEEYNKLEEDSNDIKFINQQQEPKPAEETKEDDDEFVDHFNESATDMINVSWNVS